MSFLKGHKKTEVTAALGKIEGLMKEKKKKGNHTATCSQG